LADGDQTVTSSYATKTRGNRNGGNYYMSQINPNHELEHSSQSVVGVTDAPYEMASLFDTFQQKEEKEEKLLIFMEHNP